MVSALRRPALPKSAVILIAAVGFLVADVVAHGGGKMPAAVVLAIIVVLMAAHVASRWSWLVSGLVIIDLLIPSDGRYTLSGISAFQLEPYRLFVGLLLIGWFASLLCDRRVKIRRTGFEAPLGLVLFATAGSLLLNPSRVTGTFSIVIKSISLEASFLLVIYLVVSVVRTRAILDWLVKILVCAGTIEGVSATIERKRGYNIFNHEHLLLPIFHFNILAPGVAPTRPCRKSACPRRRRNLNRTRRGDGHAGAVRDLSGCYAWAAEVVWRGDGHACRRFRYRLTHRTYCDRGHADRVHMAAAARNPQVLARPHSCPDPHTLPRPRGARRAYGGLFPKGGLVSLRVRRLSARAGFRRTRAACRGGVPSYTNSRVTTRCSVKGSEPGFGRTSLSRK